MRVMNRTREQPVPPPQDGVSRGGPDDSRDEALARVLVAHRGRFVAFARPRVRDLATAEDLVQDTLVHVLSRLADVRNEDAIVAWFFRALRNKVVDHHRRLGTADRALAEWAREVEATSAEGIPDVPLVCACVSRVAASLKPEYREALHRVEVDGVRVKDLANPRGISGSHAAVRVFRAREALRRGVIATCGECAAGGCVDCTCQDTKRRGAHPPE